MVKVRYFLTYNLERVGVFETLQEAQQAIKSHSEYTKSKYTRKGTPRSNYKDLKRFAITDNYGDMYYIY